MIKLWLLGLLRTRKARLAGAAAGVTVTVAMLASLGAFLAQSTATMTHRAVTGVPVDWQIQVTSGTPVQSVVAAVGKAATATHLQEVGYADVDGFVAHTGATVQTTGKGKVLGIAADYIRTYPREFRSLLGSLEGVLVAQQTAANLHVSVGDTVTIHRPGLAPADIAVAGIVDLPYADSLFQAVGVPPGAAPQAPPDNVLIMPIDTWHRLFDPQQAIRPDSVRMQLHVRLAHGRLPSDPQVAFTAVQRAARNLEARIAGSGIVADNLAVRLDAVRSDALYAKVLFLFLGAPGATLAALLTIAVVASGSGRRRRDQALLRIRGASLAQIMLLAAVEAACIGVAGTAGGIVLAMALTHLVLGSGLFAASTAGWVAAAALSGVVLASAVVLVTAWIDARQTTVAAARMVVGHERASLWRRAGLDFILVALSALIFWRTWSTGYQVVLAPEGVPSASVDYPVFLAPLLLWLGLGLLTVRLCLGGLKRGRARLTTWLGPIAGRLAGVVAAALSRQRKRMTQGIALVALAFTFATSTAIFNTTYNAQALIDAQLTNGADVTVTGTPQSPASAKLGALSSLPGVSAAQPMQHRLAYVGTDLQDLYGIDSSHIGEATSMSDAFFSGETARQALARLARTPDGILVSEETVKDFQLHVGDTLNLRLQNARDQQYHVVPFRFAGVVREFPTAPRDSFLVANARYVAMQTNASGAEVVLLKTSRPPSSVAAEARNVVAGLPGVKVTDLDQTQHVIGSSLTSVDLGGLTRLELGFAILMTAGATGLILSVGLADRRRMFAILSALGAKPRQLGAFLWSEACLLFVAGSVVGTFAGFALAWMLVKLLTGVFDPPPEMPSVPWLYLAALIGVALLAVVLAVTGALRETRVPAVQRMREL
ncbi:ABC transporter permease [Burkholderia pseudomultivorans]|uniref:ABC transporter permease n=1 Tax=Burkholderia pseudomultivorans TaxID=1207504 RepID=UPI00287643D2|nr:FtsX-like permease family protein [Burkholderia pseudomultivorans]MDS0859806.1 ABC transporter permease [Burkholderia pseudomultivorans]